METMTGLAGPEAISTDRPKLGITLGEKESMTTSQDPARAVNAARSAASRRSRGASRLLLLRAFHIAESPPGASWRPPGWMPRPSRARIPSGLNGGSTLCTVAPRPASRHVASGPAHMAVRAHTETQARGRAERRAGLDGEEAPAGVRTEWGGPLRGASAGAASPVEMGNEAGGCVGRGR